MVYFEEWDCGTVRELCSLVEGANPAALFDSSYSDRFLNGFDEPPEPGYWAKIRRL